ncbi:MAG: hypothetical protein HOE53_03165 [Candidatus Magasanikbacteria bacterium]|jgi:hypothetical protein|nr:hypothetical protein [Candidatus Magasanikbacteria bacterium]
MSDVKRKKGESFEQFFRRVKQGWKLSGRILQVRKVKVFLPKKSKNVQKMSAVKKAAKQSKQAYLQKIGKMARPESRFRRRR